MSNSPGVDLQADPFDVFEEWYAKARAADPEADTMSLATASADGVPACRSVLFKGLVDGGLRFFTNYNSRKGAELAANPRAALLFLWAHEDKRQIRIEGDVEPLTEADSHEYFASRDRDSQLGAWVSNQSKVIASYGVLMQNLAEVRKRFEGKTVPCPANWGGYRVVPDSFEFWEGQPARLHRRTLFTRTGATWTAAYLAP